MYLRKVHIENIRSISELDWEIPVGKEAGWHVVIGDNGSGKSTFLRAIALILIGQSEAGALRQSWTDWMRKMEEQGRIQLELGFDRRIDRLNTSFMFETETIAMSHTAQGYSETFRLKSDEKRLAELEDEAKQLLQATTLSVEAHFRRQGNDVRLQWEDPYKYHVHLWGQAWEFAGWFSVAYGPFRRFTGGDQESEKFFSTNPRLAAHLSIFDEKFALTECLKWLQDLDYRKAKEQPEGALLDRIMDFVNQESFLPYQVRLTEVSPDGVVFTDGDGHQVPVEELSDGYRSVLSMTFELIRQMSRAYKPEQIFSSGPSSKIVAPGVVLIDEVDAHLHPTWQRTIGQWFREHFPNIQFIVTTHSPLVCQAAEHGTVFRLPEPGSDEQAGMVTGIALNRLLYGDVIEAYGTQLFGEDVGRSEAGLKKLERLATLNIKELNKGLTKNEMKEQEELRAAMPTAPHRLP